MFELLYDPAYRHMLINHIPVIGLSVSAIVLLTGAALNDTRMQWLGLILVAVCAGSTLAVERFGDDAYPAVFDILDGHGRAWLDEHVERADQWIFALYMNFGFAVFAGIAAAVRSNVLRVASFLVVISAAMAISSAAWIANAGGKIQHPEFRIDDLPRSKLTST